MENRITISDKSKCCILVFAKYPKAGMVKTRLAEAIGPQRAARLYKYMALDTIDYVKQTNFPFEILYWPSEFREQMSAEFGTEHIYIPQEGNDLSQRLINAFGKAFNQGFEYVIAIGSDSPDMPLEFIKEGFAHLISEDAVLGPTADGGYYLIGFSKKSFFEEVFDNVLWSTPQVLSQTLEALKNRNKTFSLLGSWYDLDTVEDLRWFMLRYRGGSCSAHRSLSYILREIPLYTTAISGDRAHVRL